MEKVKFMFIIAIFWQLQFLKYFLKSGHIFNESYASEPCSNQKKFQYAKLLSKNLYSVERWEL